MPWNRRASVRPAVRLHEHQPGRAEFSRHRLDIAAQDRREVGVDDGGVAAGHQLHQRARAVAGGDLGEADVARDLGHAPLVFGEAIAVHKDDGDRADAGVERVLEGHTRRLLVERRQHAAFRVDPLVDLDHPLVEHLGQHDVAGEQLRPVLVTDAQGVGEALGDRQHHPIALALQQRVGGDRGAHLYRLDPLGRDRRAGIEPQHLANALHSRVPVALRVLRQQLLGDDLPVRRARHHVGERPAPIDPELPVPIVIAAHYDVDLPASERAIKDADDQCILRHSHSDVLARSRAAALPCPVRGGRGADRH